MYIRHVTQKNLKTGKQYISYRLAETYRNAQGKVRQQTLLNLGANFSIPKEEWKLLADRIEEICQGQSALFALDTHLEIEAQSIAKQIIHKNSCVIKEEIKIADVSALADYQAVDLNSMEHRDIRKIGGEHVGYHAAKQLNLDKILASVGFNQKQIQTALGSIIGRLVHPGSERSTHRYLTQHSALDELLNTQFSKLPLKNLYKVSDLLWKNKTLIEQQLYQREKDLFQLDDVVTLFDLTNTYFEGRCLSNKKARHGRSKEKRTDCPLVTLAMVLDVSGFPKKSEIFPGNVGEPKTLQLMLETLGGDKKVTVIMDAGIASQENIDWLKNNGYHYIVVSRKRNLVMPENQERVIVKEEKNNTVQVSLIKNEDSQELELYCHSQAKEAKSHTLITKAASRFEIELQKLSAGLHKKNGTKQYGKLLERLGRLKEKHKQVAHLYEVSVQADEKNKNVTDISWGKNNETFNQKERGIYCLRTNQTDLDEKTFWNMYTMLTELEAAFRSLKCELGLRPVYHQKESRVDGHLFISLLAYHLLHTIRYQLKNKGIHESWETLREILDTQCRITTALRLKDGKTVTLRKTNSPDANQTLIYNALGIITLPGNTEKAYS